MEPKNKQNEVDPACLSYNVFTDHGACSIENVEPGYKVLGFEDGREIEVKEVIKTELNKSLMIMYSDGRLTRYLVGDYIYTGEKSPNKIIKINEDVIKNMKSIFTEFNQHKIPFFDGSPLMPARQPALMMGAITMHGDFSCPYVNVNTDTKTFRSIINKAYHNHHDFDTVIDEKKDDTTQSILTDKTKIMRKTWEQYLQSDRDIFGFYEVVDEKFCLPNSYQYGPYSDREDFIKGAFSIGLAENMEGISVYMKSQYRAKALQNMLYSLGISSKLGHVQETYKFRGYPCILTLIGINKDNYPEFLKDIPDLQEMMNNRSEEVRYNSLPCHSLKVAIVKPYDADKEFYTYQLVLEGGSNQLYLTTNYLPRVSV